MQKFDPVLMDLPEMDPVYPSALIPFTFESSGSALLARMMVASGKGPHPVAILFHGFPGNEPNFDLAHALCRAGWNVLFFHYRGSWGTPGTFSYSNALEDGLAAVEFVTSKRAQEEFRCDPKKILLFGHSMGGFIALQTAAADRRVSGVATIAAFNFGAFAAWMRGNAANTQLALGLFQKNLGPVRGATAQGLVQEALDNEKRFNLENLGDQLRKIPLLIQYGSRDDVSVPEAHHHPLMKALSENRVASLQERRYECDHMFMQVRVGLCRQVIDWAEKLK